VVGAAIQHFGGPNQPVSYLVLKFINFHLEQERLLVVHRLQSGG
jgi:hypothetical protein